MEHKGLQPLLPEIWSGNGTNRAVGDVAVVDPCAACAAAVASDVVADDDERVAIGVGDGFAEAVAAAAVGGSVADIVAFVVRIVVESS